MSNKQWRGRGRNFKPFNRGNSKPKFGNKEYSHQNQLSETDVGITEFISKLEGFSGIIKARFSDFQVNEIDLDGKIAKLTDQQIPKDFQVKEEVLGEPLAESPVSCIPQDVWDSIKKIANDADLAPVELDATEISKELRVEVHECLRKSFGRKIVCNTVNTDDKRKMVFKKFTGKDEDRRSEQWPKDKGEYVHFILYKECLDTLEATLKVANCLKMAASNFTYAGVKDRRAKTTQWVSVRKVFPWKLIIKPKFLRNIKIGNITFKDKPLKLGDLSGNKFRIALRNVQGDDDLINQSLQSIKDKGFINYFGLQRFGNDKEVPTFSIGVALLLGNWQEACEIILKVTESDRLDLDITKAKKIYAETKDASKALDEFEESRKTCIEYLLLSGLSKGHGNDYVNALSSLPRNTRLLYIHSFQSLVWNFVVSKRIEKFGLDVVEGDLVFLDTSDKEEVDENDEENSEPKRPQVKALSADECSNYTIFDIVLPLPGYDVTYPKHLEDLYKEILEKYGLSLEMTQQKVREYSVSGTYRKLLGQVKDLSWTIMHYNDPNSNLIRSDFEELLGHEEPKNVEGGSYKALILDFSLTPASYATMVLREILKTDTSSSSHAKLNNYHTETKTSSEEKVVNNVEDVGLLGDAQKYEAFKSLVFGEEETTLKRKHEDDPTENVKMIKTEENGN